MCNDANNLLQMQVLTPAPTITVQPAATTAVTEGNISGSLSITATGEEGATLSYQWQKKGTGDSWSDISGETNTSYSIPTDLTMGSHDFRCVVTATKDGATRTTTSNTATVTVKAIISGVVVTPYNAAYDGQTHDKCIVSGYPEDSTVTYSENGESFSSTTPTVKDATTGSPFWVRVEHANYATWTSGKLEAVVSKVQLTVSDTAIASTKEYDGNLAASVTTHGTLGGLVSGETLKLTCTATYADKNVGTDKAVTLTYELADDTSGSATYYANNYIAPASSTTIAAITAKPLRRDPRLRRNAKTPPHRRNVKGNGADLHFNDYQRSRGDGHRSCEQGLSCGAAYG